MPNSEKEILKSFWETAKKQDPDWTAQGRLAVEGQKWAGLRSDWGASETGAKARLAEGIAQVDEEASLSRQCRKEIIVYFLVYSPNFQAVTKLKKHVDQSM